MHAPESNITFEKVIHAKVEEDTYNLIATRAGLRKTTISGISREILTEGALSQATTQTVHEELMGMRALMLWLVTEFFKQQGKAPEEITEMIAEKTKTIDANKGKIARKRAQEAAALRG